MGPTKRGKGTKIMVIADEGSLPVAVSVDSASPHEVTLVEETLARQFVSKNPDRLVADRAYDSDPLDALLLKRGVRSPYTLFTKKGLLWLDAQTFPATTTVAACISRARSCLCMK